MPSFWKSHRVISKMRRNPESLAKIRVAVMVYWRRRKVGERSTAIDMIQVRILSEQSCVAGSDLSGTEVFG